MTTSAFAPRPAEVPRPPLATDNYYGTQAKYRVLNAVRNFAARGSEPLRHLVYRSSSVGDTSLAVLDRLRNSEEGATGVIVCNGPSINSTDLSLVRDRPYIILNRGYLLRDKFDHPASALCVHDPLVIEQFGQEIQSSESTVIAHHHALSSMSRRDDIAFLQSTRRWAFATRLGLTSHHGCTVTFWALEVAFLLGWRKALIVGMDHNFVHSAAAASEVAVVRAGDRGHFSASYYPPGTKLLTPDIQAIEYSYTLARSAFELEGREVVDCTVNGQCDVFRKSSLHVEI